MGLVCQCGQQTHAPVRPLSNRLACYPADWPLRRMPPCLSARQIHLCVVDLSLLLPASAELTAAEHRRAARYRNPQQRALYLGGRIGLRRLLRHYSGIDNHRLDFVYGARGKPRLNARLTRGQLDFNYALSRTTGLYAFAWNRRLGVDLETFPRALEADRMAQRKLSEEERRAWYALPARARPQAMLSCWTRKEAYGKTLGVGIRYHLQQVELFRDLHCYQWQTRVAGLFEHAGERSLPEVVHGLQLRLPFAGAAAMMYDGEPITDLSRELVTYTYASGRPVHAAGGIADADH